MKILEENLDGVFLTVVVEIPLRITVAEKIEFINSKDVITLLDSKYKVINIVKNNRLSNSMRGGGKQKGSWIFQIEEIKTRKPRKPRVRKPPPAPKKTPTTAKLPKQESPTETKPSTKSSIRGRISKIAKEKLSDK